ncbi:MAG: hypothetical protein CSA40_00395 [Flavobacteriales bacterium]|nr:MAG: hypothetical protein CSA40_00395 [Flavobacteriales bacterium]
MNAVKTNKNKTSTNVIIKKHLLTIVIFGAVGFLLRDFCYNLPMSYSVGIIDTSVSDQMKGSVKFRFLFPLIIAMVPLLNLFVKKVTKGKAKALAVYFIILYCGLSFMIFKIMRLILFLEQGEPMYLRSMNLDLYMFAGFITGTIISMIIFVEKTKPE